MLYDRHEQITHKSEFFVNITVDDIGEACENDYEHVLSEMKNVNNSLAKFCRSRALHQRIRDMTEETRHFRLVITQGCNNLNQIARHFNKDGVSRELIEQVKQQILFLQEIRKKIIQ